MAQLNTCPVRRAQWSVPASVLSACGGAGARRAAPRQVVPRVRPQVVLPAESPISAHPGEVTTGRTLAVTVEDGLVLRYRVEGTDTGFAGAEGTFTICSFWLVTALAMIGETGRAHALCQKLLSFAGPLLLFAEEIDTTTGEHLGNFPQAFTHLALIEAVSKLIEMERRSASPPPDDRRR
jgi:hypothetical protein